MLTIALALVACGDAEPPPQPAPGPERESRKPVIRTPAFDPVLDDAGNAALRVGRLQMKCPADWKPTSRTFTNRFVVCASPDLPGVRCVGATETAAPDATPTRHSEQAVKHFEAAKGPADSRADEALEVDGTAIHRNLLVLGDQQILTFTGILEGRAGVVACTAGSSDFAEAQPMFDRIGRSLQMTDPVEHEPDDQSSPPG